MRKAAYLLDFWLKGVKNKHLNLALNWVNIQVCFLRDPLQIVPDHQFEKHCARLQD